MILEGRLAAKRATNGRFSGCCEHDLRLGLDLRPNWGAEKLRRVEIDGPSQDLREFFLYVEERESWRVAVFELHEHVDIAIAPERSAERRAEQGQPSDVMTPAKFGDCSFRDV